MDGSRRWWEALTKTEQVALSEIWIAVGSPGYAGPAKARWRATLDEQFGADGWRMGHVVRGAIVPPSMAIAEYEASYRAFLRAGSTAGALVTAWVRPLPDDAYGPAMDALRGP